MLCQKCEKDVGESKFCPECGTKIETVRTESTTNPIAYDDIKNANIEAGENLERKKRKKKLIGCLTPILIIVLFIAGIIVANKIKSLGPAIEIRFSSVYSQYSLNASAADDEFGGKKYVFYFIPYEIEENGTCHGTLYDSFGNKWKWYDTRDERISYGWNIKFSNKEANELVKGKAYKIEGNFNVTYDSSNNDFWANNLSNSRIVDENVTITLKDY